MTSGAVMWELGVGQESCWKSIPTERRVVWKPQDGGMGVFKPQNKGQTARAHRARGKGQPVAGEVGTGLIMATCKLWEGGWASGPWGASVPTCPVGAKAPLKP